MSQVKKTNKDIIHPKPYSNTDYSENESVFLFQSAIDRKHIITDIKTRDKYPNYDGYIEIVNNDSVPLGKLEVQVRTIDKDSTTYYCPLENMAYSETTTLPMLLILVDIENKKVFWKHLKRENAVLTKQGKSYLHFLMLI